MGYTRMSRGKVALGRGCIFVVAALPFTYNPPSLAAGAEATSTDFAVPGAAFGDLVLAMAPYDLQGVMVTGYVQAAGIVKLRLRNGTAGTIDLASGVWKLFVMRASPAP